jgi:hypothetical protein
MIGLAVVRVGLHASGGDVACVVMLQRAMLAGEELAVSVSSGMWLAPNASKLVC